MTSLVYADGALVPAAGDLVLGAGVKGRVSEVGPAKVKVKSRGEWNPSARTEKVIELDPAKLTLVKRMPVTKPKTAAQTGGKVSFLDRLKMGRRRA